METPVPRQRFEPATSYERALSRAAEAWGIEPEYWDTWGKKRVTAPPTQRGILEALGILAGGADSLNKALEEKLWNEWNRPLPPVLVLSANARPAEFALTVPASLAEIAVTVTIRWEDGSRDTRELSLGELKTSATASLRGQAFVRKQAPLPARRPLGYHEIEVSSAPGAGPAVRATARLILCPDRVYAPPSLEEGGKAAGLAVSLYGVRSSRNWGCGDLTDLEELTGWLAGQTGAGMVGLNPLHALANRQPYNISPYLPSSICYRNALYLDVERVEEFRDSPRARRWLASPPVRDEIEALRAAEFVEYERVYALKLRALRFAFSGFLRKRPWPPEFEAYLQREGELLDRFAVYCALDAWIHARNPEVWVWQDWPADYRDPDSEATRTFARRHWRLVLFHKYAQWQLDRQLQAAQERARAARMPIGLYHDLALAVDRCGGDLWAYPGFFVSGCRVGAPPDGFSPKGQDWSFPPPDAARRRADGYRLFVETVRHNCRHGGALRFDHVMRFFRLYWIPEGMNPTQGAYVREDHEDLLRILALESVRNKTVIVGEDLGTVTPEIRRTLDRFGILGYKVPYFEKTSSQEFRAPADYPERALAASSTHDLPTLAGFWSSRDIDARQRAGLLSPDSGAAEQFAGRAREKQKLLELLHRLRLLPEWYTHWEGDLPEWTGELQNALVGFLALTPSRLMVLNQEDLFKESEQQNLPATTWQYPNWRRKMRFSLEELRSAPARDFTAMFRDWLLRSGRTIAKDDPRTR